MSKATDEQNATADEIWQQVRDSPLASIYLLEVETLASNVVTEIDAALSLIGEDPPRGHIIVNHDVHRHLTQAVGAAGRLRGMVAKRSKGSKQSAHEYKLHTRRAGWLANDILAGVDLSALDDAQVRHTLEHHDEYLDRISLQLIDGTLSRPALVPIDMVISHRHLLQQFDIGGERSNDVFVRIYITTERRFVNCGHEVDVAQLRATADEVTQRLGEILGKDRDTSGSSMIVLTHTSFDPPSPS